MPGAVTSHPPKLFCIGFNKTGTTSLETMFTEQLGLRVCHDPDWLYWSHTDATEAMDAYDVFVDGECANVPALRAMYPTARFVLNTRPLAGWLASRYAAVERSKRLFVWFADRYSPLGRVAEAVGQRVLRSDDAAIARWVRIRNTYHQWVLDHFADQPESFQVIDLVGTPEAATASLSELLGCAPLVPVHDNAAGADTLTGRMYNAIFESPAPADADAIVAAFLERNGLTEHADTLTTFDDPEWLLPPNWVDAILRARPRLEPVQRTLLAAAARRRHARSNTLARTVADQLIRLLRGRKTPWTFIPTARRASGSR